MESGKGSSNKNAFGVRFRSPQTPVTAASHQAQYRIIKCFKPYSFSRNCSTNSLSKCMHRPDTHFSITQWEPSHSKVRSARSPWRHAGTETCTCFSSRLPPSQGHMTPLWLTWPNTNSQNGGLSLDSWVAWWDHATAFCDTCTWNLWSVACNFKVSSRPDCNLLMWTSHPVLAISQILPVT